MLQSVGSKLRTTVTVSEGKRLLPHSVSLSLVFPTQMIQILTFSDLEGPVDLELNPEEGPVKDPVVESTRAEDLEGAPVDLVVGPVEGAGTVVGLVLFVKSTQPTLSTVDRSRKQDPQPDRTWQPSS